MNIGLFFGSFNPIHTGHLIIASHIAENTLLHQVWFVISPQNPLKKGAGLLNEYHRKNLIDLAIEGENKLRTSNVEFKLPRPSYTIDTLTYLDEKYPGYEFSIIMGSDSFNNIKRWKNFEVLLKNYAVLIYERPGFAVQEIAGANITILKAPLLEISSTRVRELIHLRKSIRYLVPDIVKEEIERHHYYS